MITVQFTYRFFFNASIIKMSLKMLEFTYKAAGGANKNDGSTKLPVLCGLRSVGGGSLVFT